jgi:hypothetical protein
MFCSFNLNFILLSFVLLCSIDLCCAVMQMKPATTDGKTNLRHYLYVGDNFLNFV